MKEFVKKAGLFALILVFCIVTADLLSVTELFREPIAKMTGSAEYIEGNTGAAEILPYIEKVQREDGSKVLVVGDSVCSQMTGGLDGIDSEVTFAGTNGAITLAGQYIMIAEYLEHHPHAEEVYLMLLPESLPRRFDTEWGYQYAAMPFAETKTLDRLDDETLAELERAYGKLFLQKQTALLIDRSGLNRKLYLNAIKDRGDRVIYPDKLTLPLRQLERIRLMCAEKQVALYFVAAPVSEAKKESTKQLLELFAASEEGHYFPDYGKEPVYYPEEEAADGTHFSGEYASQDHYNRLIKRMCLPGSLEERVLR